MIGAGAWLAMRLSGVGAFLRSLPWQVYAVLAAALILHFGMVKYRHDVAKAKVEGGKAQLALDQKAVAKAQAKATAAQHALVIATSAKQATISKGTSDAVILANADIDRLAAAIRLRHEAQAARGGAGQGGAIALSAATTGDHAPALTEAGSIPWSTAYLMALDAEHDATTLRAAQAWIRQQQSAWPTPLAPIGATPAAPAAQPGGQ